MHTYRGDDKATFKKAAPATGLYWIGDYVSLYLTDDELHQLRLAIDLVDDVQNGPMR
jgi:hypothetical protein